MEEEAWRWHARYGHLNFRALHDLSAKEMVGGLTLIKKVEQVCDGFALGKQHRAPFPQASAWRASDGLELVHTDLCGPITPITPGGKSYFMLVVDDHSRYMWLELLARKDEALACFKKFRAVAELELGRRLKALRTDRGGEFNSGAFVVFCSEHGIKHNTTTPYTPQQNGVVERRNQTVVEMARCLLKSMGVPPQFWGEAVKTAVYILNRSPTKSLSGVTPFEAWFGRKPGVKHLRTFGCVAYGKKVGPGVNKLSDRTTLGVFLGYEPGTKGYRIYDPVQDKLMVTRDVIFDEKKAWNWEGKEHSKAKGAADKTESFQVQWDDEDTVHGPTTEAVGPDFEPVSPTASIPSAGGASNTPPETPHSNLGTPSIQWATPPTGQSVDSEGAPLRYRTVADLLEDTEEI